MPRCSYRKHDDQDGLVWLGNRAAHAVALLANATRRPDPARVRAEELAGEVLWVAPSGALAAHALALSAADLATEIATLCGQAWTASPDWGYICALAAEMRPLSAAIASSAACTFDAVGLAERLPEPAGECKSAHHAVLVVLEDLAARTLPVFRDLGILDENQLQEALVRRAEHGDASLFDSMCERIGTALPASLLRTWPGWFSIEQKLVAEVAGAADAGLILAEGGGPLDQARFATAIARVRSVNQEEIRQDLLARWRTLASFVRQIRCVGERLPNLGACKVEVDGLAKLTAEVLAITPDKKADGPALLELLDVLRELQHLTARERHLINDHRVRELDADFVNQLQPIVSTSLRQLLRSASIEVDRQALTPPPPQLPAPPSTQAPRQTLDLLDLACRPVGFGADTGLARTDADEALSKLGEATVSNARSRRTELLEMAYPASDEMGARIRAEADRILSAMQGSSDLQPAILDRHQRKPAPRMPRVQKGIDDAGVDALKTAWDDQPAHLRIRPTWTDLAKAVHRMLERSTQINTTLTALKQRSPRTREKWEAIGAEIQREKLARRG